MTEDQKLKLMEGMETMEQEEMQLRFDGNADRAEKVLERRLKMRADALVELEGE